eukprot:gene13651-29004_t
MCDIKDAIWNHMQSPSNRNLQQLLIAGKALSISDVVIKEGFAKCILDSMPQMVSEEFEFKTELLNSLAVLIDVDNFCHLYWKFLCALEIEYKEMSNVPRPFVRTFHFTDPSIKIVNALFLTTAFSTAYIDESQQLFAEFLLQIQEKNKPTIPNIPEFLHKLFQLQRAIEISTNDDNVRASYLRHNLQFMKDIYCINSNSALQYLKALLVYTITTENSEKILPLSRLLEHLCSAYVISRKSLHSIISNTFINILQIESSMNKNESCQFQICTYIIRLESIISPVLVIDILSDVIIFSNVKSKWRTDTLKYISKPLLEHSTSTTTSTYKFNIEVYIRKLWSILSDVVMLDSTQNIRLHVMRIIYDVNIQYFTKDIIRVLMLKLREKVDSIRLLSYRILQKVASVGLG